MSFGNPLLYFSVIEKSQKNILLFKDSEFELSAKITWKSDSESIETLDFCSNGLIEKKYYKILKIQQCEADKIKFYLIHFLKHEDNTIDPYSYTAGFTDIPNLAFKNEGDLAIFRFNFYKDVSSMKDCSLTSDQPETKGGAVVVAI